MDQMTISFSPDKEIYYPQDAPALVQRPLFVLFLVLLVAAALLIAIEAIRFFRWKRTFRKYPKGFFVLRHGAIVVLCIAAAMFVMQFVYEITINRLGGTGRYFLTDFGDESGILPIVIVQAVVYAALAEGAARLIRLRRKESAVSLAPFPFGLWELAAGAFSACAAWFCSGGSDEMWKVWLIALAFSVPICLLFALVRGRIVGKRPMWGLLPLEILYSSVAVLWILFPYLLRFSVALEISVPFGVAAYLLATYLAVQTAYLCYRFFAYLRALKEVSLLMDGKPIGAAPAELLGAVRGIDLRFAFRVHFDRYSDAEESLREIYREKRGDGLDGIDWS